MQHRNCEQCGTTYDVPTHGQHARYCSRDCRNEAYNERRRAASKKPDRDCATLTLSRGVCGYISAKGLQAEAFRVCVVCGTRFTPTFESQVCCPPTDADRARVKGQARSKCARRKQNADYRGEPGYVPDRFDCAWCGKHCRPGHSGLPAHASKFCSKRCKKRHHQGQLTHMQKAEQRLAKAAAGTQGNRVYYYHSCAECGDHFLSAHQPANNHSRYCSRKCQVRESRRRRRAQMAGAGYKTLSFRSIAQRDRFTCQLCGEPVDMSLQHPHYKAPTLDHIIPLSQGGEHSAENAQLAHFICNSRKGDGVSATRAGDQLALI